MRTKEVRQREKLESDLQVLYDQRHFLVRQMADFRTGSAQLKEAKDQLDRLDVLIYVSQHKLEEL